MLFQRQYLQKQEGNLEGVPLIKVMNLDQLDHEFLPVKVPTAQL